VIEYRAGAPVRASIYAVLLMSGLAAFAPARADVLQDIKNKKEIVIATEARYAPFEFLENGKIVGYSTDMLDLIMKDLPGVKLKRLDLPWQGILPGLDAKKFDYVVTAVTVTKERAERYHLSLPIADATLAILKRKGDESVNKPEDIAGKPVGSQSGAAQLQGLQAYDEELKAKNGGKGASEIKSYVDFNEAYADLAAGRISAVVNSLPNLLYVAKTRPDVFEVVAGTLGPKKYFSWVGRKDADSASLDKFFDEEIAKLNTSGEMAKLQKKWFGFEMSVPADKLPPPQF
jgi:polar amino acid transport system substrate-binding protein